VGRTELAVLAVDAIRVIEKEEQALRICHLIQKDSICKSGEA